jgi:hypothetical protein
MSDKPNLDLISMVQRARLAHDADAQPSQVTPLYWIEAKRQVDGPAPTERAGHWLIRTTTAEADALWTAIRAATEAGTLGYKSKVSGRGSKNERVIHVMTSDANDTADVARVRAALRDLGVAGDLTYEREQLAGDEQARGIASP